jgi:RpiB/LacA/LacB family sugar-phosphate isomerase
MKVVITSDHVGFSLKQKLFSALEADGHEIIDLGTNGETPVDYPDYALRMALFIANEEAERGIFICGSGVGGEVVLNKIRGIRAGLCHDTYSAHQGVEHDDMNILCLGSRVVGTELAIELCRTFLNAEFSGEDRHKRRLAKLREIENHYTKPLDRNK